MQALDAEHRMQILRGEIIASAAPSHRSSDTKECNSDKYERKDRVKKIRKRAGENDTDFEMRVARQKGEEAAAAKSRLVLHDLNFPERSTDAGKRMKNSEAESEAAKIKKDYEDQYTMRFSNAAGLNQNPGQLPWYLKPTVEVGSETDRVAKEFESNKNQRRQEREHKRIMNNDPLALMKSGARKVREVEKKKRLREDINNIKVQSRHGDTQRRKDEVTRDDENDDIEVLHLEHKRKKRKSKVMKE